MISKKKLGYIFILILIIIIATLFACKNVKDIPDIPSNQEETSSLPAKQKDTSKNQSKQEELKQDELNQYTLEEDIVDQNSFEFTLTFAGDINFDENWSTIKFLDQTEGGISDCISQELIEIMKKADIMCINNEFTYSKRGQPLNNKAYAFRADPSRVNILKEMGVDIVSLANNHTYDYGKESILDTFATLEDAGILYYGAGRNLEEAMKPVYFEIQGKKIAYVAASRAEKYKMTPQATENEPGILRCYDTSLFIQTIKEAKENADYVIAYVHWGTEYSKVLEEVQLSTAKDYIDAGASVIIGAHPHILQGMEYYKGKPIIYSLGNFWFNEKTLDTILLNLKFYGNDDSEQIEVEIIPALQSKSITSIVEDNKEKARIFSNLEEISINVEIDDNGIVKEK